MAANNGYNLYTAGITAIYAQLGLVGLEWLALLDYL